MDEKWGDQGGGWRGRGMEDRARKTDDKRNPMARTVETRIKNKKNIYKKRITPNRTSKTEVKFMKMAYV